MLEGSRRETFNIFHSNRDKEVFRLILRSHLWAVQISILLSTGTESCHMPNGYDSRECDWIGQHFKSILMFMIMVQISTCPVNGIIYMSKLPIFKIKIG